MKMFFKELFEYNNHFNEKLSEVFLEYPEKTSEKSVKLFNHILNAHQIWNCRVEPTQIQYDSWAMHLAHDYKDINNDNYIKSIYILDNFDLNSSVQYSNSKGEIFTKTIRDILFHVINHSTYHRAQIVTDFKLNGLESVATDYIHYKR